MSDKARKILLELNSFSKENNLTLYLIGGAVRDRILNSISIIKDIDIVFDYNIEKFAALFEEFFKTKLAVRKNFLTASYVINENLNLDFVQTRAESYPIKGGLPEVTVGSFESDRARRDFTINTLRVKLDDFLNFKNNLIEYIVNDRIAIDDIQNLKIRVLYENSFLDDPTRIFRAIRYKSKIMGSLETNTEALIKEAINANALKTISNFRALSEFIKILSEINFKNSIDDIILYKVNVPYFEFEEILELNKLLDETNNTKVFILKCFKKVLPISKFNQCIFDLNIGKKIKKEL